MASSFPCASGLLDGSRLLERLRFAGPSTHQLAVPTRSIAGTPPLPHCITRRPLQAHESLEGLHLRALSCICSGSRRLSLLTRAPLPSWATLFAVRNQPSIALSHNLSGPRPSTSSRPDLLFFPSFSPWWMNPPFGLSLSPLHHISSIFFPRNCPGSAGSC